MASPRRKRSVPLVPTPTPSPRPKRGKKVIQEEARQEVRQEVRQEICPRCEDLLKDEVAALEERQLKLDEREASVVAQEAALEKRNAQLLLFESNLKERKRALDERAAQLERESQLVQPPSAIRQQSKRAKIEERMQLATTLNRLPRESPSDGDVETLKEALSRMGKSYQDFYEGNGFLVAGSLYGTVERFLEMFSPDENLTKITPVARLLDAIKNLKWTVTSESNESAEDRAETMLYSFKKRVRDQKTMAKVTTWLAERERGLHKLTENELDLLFTTFPQLDDDDDESTPLATQFKPPAALAALPDKLILRDEKLNKKMQLADQYDDALDKDFFYQQHGKYNVMIGRALRTVCEAFRLRGGGLGRLDGSRFFFSLFPAGQAGKRKHADLGSVEEAAILIAALKDEDAIAELARLIDHPEQMEGVCAIARESVDLLTASVKDKGALERLRELAIALRRSSHRDAVRHFISKYATSEVPRHKSASECLALLEKHIGEPIIDALFELSRVDLGEDPDRDALERALNKFAILVDEVYDSSSALRPEEYDTFVIAAMLLFKRHSIIGRTLTELMTNIFINLSAIVGKRGKRFPVWDPETGSEEHLFTWPRK